MAIAFTSQGFDDVNRDARGYFPVVRSFVATGLTGGASNNVAHGLPRRPRRVWLVAAGNNAAANPSNLDTSLGDTDPAGGTPGGKLGFDSTNIYIYTGAAVTAVIVHVEY